jgi:hypothetical protein
MHEVKFKKQNDKKMVTIKLPLSSKASDLDNISV